MTNSPVTPAVSPLQAAAPTAFALLVIAASLGFFTFIVDPRLQQIAPPDAWPVIAQIMHWASTCVAAGTGILAAGLCLGALDGVWVKYFTNRRTVIAILFWALVIVALTAWAVFPLAVQLSGDRI